MLLVMLLHVTCHMYLCNFALCAFYVLTPNCSIGGAIISSGIVELELLKKIKRNCSGFLHWFKSYEKTFKNEKFSANCDNNNQKFIFLYKLYMKIFLSNWLEKTSFLNFALPASLYNCFGNL